MSSLGPGSRGDEGMPSQTLLALRVRQAINLPSLIGYTVTRRSSSTFLFWATFYAVAV